MGQYYLTVNLDKHEFIHPHKFGDGLKLLEFGDNNAGTMLGLAVLLADGNGRGGGDLPSDDPIVGSWSGNRVVIAGDYADGAKWLNDEQIQEFYDKNPKDAAYYKEHGGQPNLYVYANACFSDISVKTIAAIMADEDVNKKIKETLKEFWVRNIFTEDELTFLEGI